jgi:CRP-like cAMP-binding protein
VIHADRHVVSLATSDGNCVDGRCAFSCLVLPRAGDVVAVLRDPAGRHYVTAILERNDQGELELFSERSMTIRSEAGVRVAAATGLELEAGDRIGMRTALVEAVVGRVSAFAKALSVTSGEALLRTRLGTICADLLDVAARRIGVTAEHSHRQIEGTEQVRCRHFDLRSDVAQVQAQTTLVKARDLVKMDAAQIQIG